MNSKDIELAVVKHYGDSHTIIPNVSYSLFHYEADLLVIRKSGYCLEIEIKVSSKDIKADLKKSKWRNNNSMFGRVSYNNYIVKEFYMAVPCNLINDKNIPEMAGIIQVEESPNKYWSGVTIIRKPKIWKRARRINSLEQSKISRILGLRLWKLKSKLYEMEGNGN